MDFEVKVTDLAGRVGRFNVGGRWLETPIYLPVVHPINQVIPTSELYKMGFKAVITNAYITYRRYGESGKELGIHRIIGYDGVVMTDSGGYQMLEYGDVAVPPRVMAEYQRDIGSDIAVILDTPTGYKTKRERAEETVKLTLKATEESLDVLNEEDGPLWAGPIQGGDHLDLVTYSAKTMSKFPFDLYAIGSPVEIMNSYDFKTLVDIVMTAKRNLPYGKPAHLFGAGHPLTMALAVAMGCDMFDSASYILFAKEGRYMTFHGVKKFEEMDYLPCSCPVCSKGKEYLKDLPRGEQVKMLAMHNLYLLRAEMEAIKLAIREGRLWEYIIVKSKSHPALHKAILHLFSRKEYLDRLEEETPVFKDRAIFLFDRLDVNRPEVRRHRERLRELKFQHKKAIFLVLEEGDVPIFLKIRRNMEKFLSKEHAFFISSKFFGPIPLEVHDVFPLSQNTVSEIDEMDEEVEDSYRRLLKQFEEVGIMFEKGKGREAAQLLKLINSMGKETKMIGPVKVLKALDQV